MNRYAPFVLTITIVAIVVVGVLALGRGPDAVREDRTTSVATSDTRSPIRVLDTDLDDTILDWLAGAPTEGSTGSPPTTAVLGSAAATYRALIDGDLTVAGSLADEFAYDVEELARGSALRPEDAALAPYGVYVHRPSGRALLVEVPHPFSERLTVEAGARLAETLDARDLLVAGAHRRAGSDTDVAHAAASVFETVHRQALSADATVVQLHGFDPANHPGLSADVILSSGTPDPNAPVTALEATLVAAGFDVCVYDGTACAGLAGTTNQQGRSAREAGAHFVHIEIALPVRLDATSFERLLGALASGLSGQVS